MKRPYTRNERQKSLSNIHVCIRNTRLTESTALINLVLPVIFNLQSDQNFLSAETAR
jgi:hypothetical protein